jgi:hypothetical protein
MKSENMINAEFIAPCGMNCGICSGHLRDKKSCPGCRGNALEQPVYCASCRIRNCAEFKDGQKSFCFECASFPCLRLRQLDKRYRLRYGMSMLENLKMLKTVGLPAFVQQEQTRWACPQCDGIICVHKGTCVKCGSKRADGFSL